MKPEDVPFVIHFYLPKNVVERSFTKSSPFYKVFINSQIACQGVEPERLTDDEFIEVYLAACDLCENLPKIMKEFGTRISTLPPINKKFIDDVLESRRLNNEYAKTRYNT